MGKIYQVCTDWRNAVLDLLDRLKPDVVLVGSAATYKFSESQWLEGSSRVMFRLSNSAEKVLVIPGTPDLGFDGPGCIARNLRPEGKIERSACVAEGHLQRVDSVARLLDKAAGRFTNVHLLNLNDLVCPEGRCRAMNDKGVPVFRDSQHLTDSFVRTQVPAIRRRMSTLYRPNGNGSQ
jgi:hypothetical protein